MFEPNGAEWVLWVHVLAACVWIGGQITLATLVPLLRSDRAVLTAAARRFGYISWTAFALLVLTGIWNVHNAGIAWGGASKATHTLDVKLVFVILSGVSAALHSLVAGPKATATGASGWRAASGILGAVTLLAALVAALYGVVIAQQ